MQRNDPALPRSIPSPQSGLGGFRHLYQLSIKTPGILSVVRAPVTARAQSDQDDRARRQPHDEGGDTKIGPCEEENGGRPSASLIRSYKLKSRRSRTRLSTNKIRPG